MSSCYSNTVTSAKSKLLIRSLNQQVIGNSQVRLLIQILKLHLKDCPLKCESAPIVKECTPQLRVITYLMKKNKNKKTEDSSKHPAEEKYYKMVK